MVLERTHKPEGQKECARESLFVRYRALRCLSPCRQQQWLRDRETDPTHRRAAKLTERSRTSTATLGSWAPLAARPATTMAQRDKSPAQPAPTTRTQTARRRAKSEAPYSCRATAHAVALHATVCRM